MPKIDLALAQSVVQPRPQDSYKGKFGRILIIGGNKNFGGAAIMSASAAVYAGGGLVTTATDAQNFTALHARLPESMILDYTDTPYLDRLLPDMDVIVIGPGLGTEPMSLAILTHVLADLKKNQALIIDGSAITLLAQQGCALPTTGHLILTPHQMEWQRLAKLKIADQTDTANQAALDRLAKGNQNITLILKSAQTKVYLPSGEIWINEAGNPGLATGGSGDTLTGILAAFIGQFTPTSKAILAGVYTHSAIADELAQTNYVTLPQEIIPRLPNFMYRLAHN